jgi:hypothetical protein
MSTRGAPREPTAGRSGRDIAAEYVARLDAECERAWNEEEPLPRLPTGAINKSLLADRCGFPRRVFATNPAALELLNTWDARDRQRRLNGFDQARAHRERKEKSDDYTHRLERRVLELEAEVASLRRECARFVAIETLMIKTGKLP